MRNVDDVARDLSAICELIDALEDQAVAKSTDREIPGGAAMVALGPVASPEAWEHVYEAREERGRDVTHVADHDDDFAPPLQLLLFWSEEWRREHNRESDRRPTVASEAAFIRQCLDWAWEHEVRFEDFAADVRKARVRLEEALYAGRRVERSRVLCIADDCETHPRLIKVYRDNAAFDHYKCPACKAIYSPGRFTLAKAELLASQDADRHVSMQDALNAIDRPERTFRKWLRLWYVRSYRDPRTGVVMVWWPDVRETDLATPRRKRNAA